MGSARLWCRVGFVGIDGTELFVRRFDGVGPPDISLVDELARLALLAGRLGVEIVVTELADELRELLELTGLVVEVQGQAKAKEEPLRLEGRQEEVHGNDPAT
jgi:hypothetical protein